MSLDLRRISCSKGPLQKAFTEGVSPRAARGSDVEVFGPDDYIVQGSRETLWGEGLGLPECLVTSDSLFAMLLCNTK